VIGQETALLLFLEQSETTHSADIYANATHADYLFIFLSM